MNLINNQPDIVKINLYGKIHIKQDINFAFFSTRLKQFNDAKAFIEYSNNMQVVYKNTEECNLGKKRKILIVFDDMITDMINNKKLNPVVTELFIRGRKLNISIAFITQSYFKVPKDVRLNSTHFFYENVK